MMNSKKAAVLAALALGGAVLLAGCGGGEKQQTSKEKVFTYGTTAYSVSNENAGTNPHNSYVGWTTIRYGIGETLFRFKDNLELEPWLAKDYQQIDDNTVKINLKDNITFSNGKKVTGEAVKACLEALIKNHDRAPGDLKIESITAEGQSVTIKSKEKTPALLNSLSDPYGCIIDVEAGEKDRIVVGTGPYVAVSVTDNEIVLKKNDKYWGAVKPKLDKIVVKGILDGDTLTMALQNGEIDAAQGLPYASHELFNDTAKFTKSQANTSRVFEIDFNFKTPELQDVKVRKAISMAIDKEGFTKVLLKGNGAPAVGPYPDSMTFGGKAVTASAYDLEGAKALLKEAGYQDTDGDGYVDKNGKNLELRYLSYPSRQELPLLAESAQASLKKIGVKLNVNVTDNYKSFRKNGEYDMFANAFVTAPTGDPEYYLSTHYLTGASYNYGFYSNPTMDALGHELHNAFGAEARAKLAIRMEQLALDDCAYIYASHLRMSLIMKKGIKGLTAHPSDYYEITSELDKE